MMETYFVHPPDIFISDECEAQNKMAERTDDCLLDDELTEMGFEILQMFTQLNEELNGKSIEPLIDRVKNMVIEMRKMVQKLGEFSQIVKLLQEQVVESQQRNRTLETDIRAAREERNEMLEEMEVNWKMYVASLERDLKEAVSQKNQLTVYLTEARQDLEHLQTERPSTDFRAKEPVPSRNQAVQVDLREFNGIHSFVGRSEAVRDRDVDLNLRSLQLYTANGNKDRFGESGDLHKLQSPGDVSEHFSQHQETQTGKIWSDEHTEVNTDNEIGSASRKVRENPADNFEQSNWLSQNDGDGGGHVLNDLEEDLQLDQSEISESSFRTEKSDRSGPINEDLLNCLASLDMEMSEISESSFRNDHCHHLNEGSFNCLENLQLETSEISENSFRTYEDALPNQSVFARSLSAALVQVDGNRFASRGASDRLYPADLNTCPSGECQNSAVSCEACNKVAADSYQQPTSVELSTLAVMQTLGDNLVDCSSEENALKNQHLILDSDVTADCEHLPGCKNFSELDAGRAQWLGKGVQDMSTANIVTICSKAAREEQHQIVAKVNSGISRENRVTNLILPCIVICLLLDFIWFAFTETHIFSIDPKHHSRVF